MSGADWQAGDLAICIDDNWCRCGRTDCGIRSIGPKKEQLLKVTDVHLVIGRIFLAFEGIAADHLWHEQAFRKVRPDTEPAADEAWVEQLRHLRRREPA